MRWGDRKTGETIRCAEIESMVGHHIDSIPEAVPHAVETGRQKSLGVVLGGTTFYLQHNPIVLSLSPIWSPAFYQRWQRLPRRKPINCKGVMFLLGFSGLVLPGAGSQEELPQAIKTGGRWSSRETPEHQSHITSICQTIYLGCFIGTLLSTCPQLTSFSSPLPCSFLSS